MSIRIASFALVAAVIAGGGFALVSREESSSASATTTSAATLPNGTSAFDPSATESLPPNHPPINGSAPNAVIPSSEDHPAISWKVPASWVTIANPNAMRIATYRVLRATGDADDATTSVSRAGGTTEANIQRWLGQFDDAGQEVRTVKTTRGRTITVIEVSGTYLEGGMSGTASKAHTGWTLVGAIVETDGAPYFFKLVGPSATVRNARAGFDELLASIAPT